MPSQLPTNTQAPFLEFVLLMACMMSMVAMSIDAMLPALPYIGHDLAVEHINHTQLIITLIFLGMAIGTIMAGPLADSFGRKPIVCLGFALFIIGCLLAYFSQTFEQMLIARLLQGIGVSGPRILTTTLVRDKFEGRIMAKVMSLVMTIFILIPIVAPFFGQWILSIGDWRDIFLAFIIIAACVCLWFILRQEETLKVADKQTLSPQQIWHNAKQVLSYRSGLIYTIASGLISGAFITFLSTVQQIFQQIYLVGDNFVYYFAAFAASVGLASLTNSRIVMKYGMKRICIGAMSVSCFISAIFLAYCLSVKGVPPLKFLIPYLSTSLFFIGLLFGNLNAQAMKPLGHLSGIGSSFVAATGTLISLPIAVTAGQFFNHSVTPLILVMLLCSACALIIITQHERKIKQTPVDT